MWSFDASQAKIEVSGQSEIMTKPSRYTSLMDAPQAAPQHRPIPRVSGRSNHARYAAHKTPPIYFLHVLLETVPLHLLSPPSGCYTHIAF